MPDIVDHVRDLLAGRHAERIAQVLNKHETTVEGDDFTRFPLDYRVPDAPQDAVWRITTRVVPGFGRPRFSREAVSDIRRVSSEKGRSLYCFDTVTGQIVAAIAYHYPAAPSSPIELVRIALRDDWKRHPGLMSRSITGALLIKHVVHMIGTKFRNNGTIIICIPKRNADERWILEHDLAFGHGRPVGTEVELSQQPFV